MTQEQILEYNKLCAEFLGFNQEIVNNEIYFTLDNMLESLSEEELKFHEDWNWIMEVVQKCLIGEAEHNPEISNVTIKNIYESLCNTNIEDVLESCIKYIKWYNNHE